MYKVLAHLPGALDAKKTGGLTLIEVRGRVTELADERPQVLVPVAAGSGSLPPIPVGLLS